MIEIVHPIKGLHTTILHLMGLDDSKLAYFHGGRHRQLPQTGREMISERLAQEIEKEAGTSHNLSCLSPVDVELLKARKEDGVDMIDPKHHCLMRQCRFPVCTVFFVTLFSLS